jgi:hypothetical protein
MIKKSSMLLMALPLIGAIAGPVAYFKLFDRSKSAASASEVPAPTAQPTAYFGGGTVLAASSGTAAVSPASAGAAVPRTGVRVQDIGSVFNFEITPEWVLARWPNVSTGLAEIQLEGYRAPLVTGTAAHDLAGSLTYYFDARQKLQRIAFFGVTGDPRAVVGLLVNRFRMTRRLTNDPGLVVYQALESNQRLSGQINIRLAPAGDSAESYRRYNIEISLARPEE